MFLARQQLTNVESATAVLSATEIEEYNIMRDHCEYDDINKKLHVRCPFSKDPSVLINNSNSALARQVSAEKKQIKMVSILSMWNSSGT